MFLNCVVPVLLIIEITCWALLPNLHLAKSTCLWFANHLVAVYFFIRSHFLNLHMLE